MSWIEKDRKNSGLNGLSLNVVIRQTHVETKRKGEQSLCAKDLIGCERKK